jgi:hypothetical protein
MKAKSNFRVFMRVVFTLTTALILVGCESPKSLAKQTWDLEQQVFKVGSDDLAKSLEIGQKAAKIALKVEKLSEKDAAIYAEELVRLAGGTVTSDGGNGKTSGGKTASKAEDFKYDLNDSGDGVVIQGLIGDPETDEYVKINIPAKIEGYPVVAIESLTINSHSQPVSSISIPDSVTVIGVWAFHGFRIKEIKLPSNLKKICMLAFWDCDLLKSIEFPAGLEVIEEAAFISCDSLKSVKIPDSIQNIGANAFNNCPELTDVEIPAHPIKYMAGIIEYHRGMSHPPEYEYVEELSANGAFAGCPRLSLATRQKIKDTSYTGEF